MVTKVWKPWLVPGATGRVFPPAAIGRRPGVSARWLARRWRAALARQHNRRPNSFGLREIKR